MDRQLRPGTGTRVGELDANSATTSPGKRTLVEAEFLRGSGVGNTTPVAHSATPTQVAERHSELNAIIKVVAFSAEGTMLRSWRAKGRWEGALPQHFHGEHSDGRWSWDDVAARTVRINTRADGSGGQPVEIWAASLRAARVEIVAESLEGSEHADLDDQGRPVSARRLDSSNDHAEAGRRRTAAEGDNSSLNADAGPSDRLVDAIALELELDINLLEAEDVSDDAAGVGGDIADHADDNASAAGHGPGGERAREGGDREGSTSTRDNLGTRTGSRDGDPLGAANGLPLGEGRESDDGVRGAGGIIGVIAIPATLKGAVEIALLLEAGDITGAGAKLFTAGIGRAASVAAGRRLVAREARIAAAKELRSLRKQLGDRKAFAALSRDERAQVLRIVYWEYQRRFFRGYLQAAKAEQRAARNALRNAKPSSMAVSEARREAGDAGVELATVEPVAGRLPVNHQYAGKDFPRELLPPTYRKHGLRFKDTGYPDFEPYAMTLPNGRKRVKIEFTGSYRADELAANKAAGLEKRPKDWRWHHEEGDHGSMLLVPKDLHETVKHSGGVAGYKHRTGVEYGN